MLFATINVCAVCVWMMEHNMLDCCIQFPTTFILFNQVLLLLLFNDVFNSFIVLLVMLMLVGCGGGVAGEARETRIGCGGCGVFVFDQGLVVHTPRSAVPDTHARCVRC